MDYLAQDRTLGSTAQSSCADWKMGWINNYCSNKSVPIEKAHGRSTTTWYLNNPRELFKRVFEDK